MACLHRNLDRALKSWANQEGFAHVLTWTSNVAFGVALALMLFVEVVQRLHAGELKERVFGSWSLVCAARANGACTLSQVVSRDPKGTQVVLGAVVEVDPSGARPRIVFRMSPQADRAAGIGMKIDKGAEYRLAMTECDARVCMASGWLEGPLRAGMEQGTVAQIAFYMPEKRQVVVPLSLKGLADGLAALSRASQP